MQWKEKFIVSCEIDGSNLCGKVITKIDDSSTMYSFTFYKDGFLILKTKWVGEYIFQIEHLGPGVYSVDVQYKSENEEGYAKSDDITLYEFGKYILKQPSLIIQGENLISRIHINKTENTKTQCYLLRYGVVTDRTAGWTTAVNHSWPIKNLDQGVYVAQWFVKEGPIKLITFSEPFLFMTPEQGKSLTQDIKKHTSDFTPPRILNYHYPDQSFILHYKKNKSNINFIVEEDGFRRTTLFESELGTCDIHHTNNLLNHLDSKIFFSGFCNTKNGFIYGVNDLRNINHIDELQNCVGKYSLICNVPNNNKVLLMNDLFGIRHHYLYEDENSVICSNDLHLLVKNLHFNKVDLKINWEILSTIFCFDKVQPFSQNFLRNLPINGLKKLPSGAYLEFDKTNFTIKDNEMASLLEKARSSDLDYSSILEDTADELTFNFQSFLENEFFSEYSVDMSGGLDTRLVAAIISNIEDRDKMSINCYQHPSEPFEVNIAAEINTLLDLKWDNQIYHTTLNDPGSIYSRFFGDYFAHRETSFFNKTPKGKLRLTGFFGEVCARYYYPRGLMRRKSNLSRYFNDISRYALLGTNSTFGFSSTKTLFLEELNQLETPDEFDKFDLHYCNFRAGSHCDSKWRNYISGPDLSPLQSKNLFILKYSKLYNKDIPSLQFEIIKKLNRDMLRVPYSNRYDNIDYAIYSGQSVATMKKQPISDSIENQLEKRSISKNRDKSIHVKEVEDGWGRSHKEYSNTDINYNIENALSFILQNSPDNFIDDVLLPLKMYLRHVGDGIVNHELKNKLITACCYIYYTR